MNGDVLASLAPRMIVGLEGTSLSDGEREILRRRAVAGVILFERNVSGSRGLMELTQEIRRIFREERGTAPIVAADHEGGLVSVLARAIGTPPTQGAAGRTADAALCDRLFAENARRMRSCGVNMLLGPVADLDTDPDNPVIGLRSFGADPELVSRLVATAVGAARREGVLTCVKHFPGHGPTSVDSHLALPVLSADLDELRARDVRPFARGLAAGAESVMMGHIAPRGRALPASLDPAVIGGVLRDELGFGGVVMTDAIEMEGIRRAAGAGKAGEAGGGGARSVLEICRAAVEAGNDILLFSRGVVGVFERLGADVGPAGSGASLEAFSAAAGAASLERVRRLVDAAAARDREFELPRDAGVYREIAERSIEIVEPALPGEDSAPAGTAGAFGFGDGAAVAPPRLEFVVEKGELDRHPARSFVERVARALGAGASVGDFAAAPVPDAPDLEALARHGAGDGAARIVLLLNRRPVAAEIARRSCAGAAAVVVAGWPYAARHVDPGPRVLVTRGIYDAAADAVASRLRECLR